MSIYGNVSTATASVGANTNAVTITGLDLTIVSPGMTINLGARDRKTGDAYVIASAAPTGTSGGSLTLVGTVPTAFTSAPFLIDTTGYLGTDSSYAATVSLKLLDTLNKLFGPATNLFAGSRQLVFDKVASTAIGRIAFAIAGRTWGDLAQRSLTYTPTGGQATTAETLAVRAFPDGTTPSDVILVDLTAGGADVQTTSSTMVAASTVDLASAPTGKVTIVGAATINGFGAGKHKVRDVLFQDGGAVLAHNATSLILPGRANITVRAGDTLRATSDGSGNWRVRSYDRADGAPVGIPYIVAEALGENGYRKWSDGWIEQWGYLPAQQDGQVTFPIAFASVHHGAVVSPIAAGQAATTVLTVWWAKRSLAQMEVFNRYTSQGSTGLAASPLAWKAWGF
ncbi:hypothetical protein C0214_01130 [Methylobacterium sp. DM1]|nr:hypothetical protein C0214_01130 [Methylobacterium sp. DM1]